MPYEVQLRHETSVDSVIVEEVHLSDMAILTGFDPYFCPDGMKEHIVFTSRGPSGIIWPGSEVELVSVTPTEEPVPEPEPVF